MIAFTLSTDLGLAAWPYLSMTWRLELALNKKQCSVIGRLTTRPGGSYLVAQHCPLIFPRVALVLFALGMAEACTASLFVFYTGSLYWIGTLYKCCAFHVAGMSDTGHSYLLSCSPMFTPTSR